MAIEVSSAGGTSVVVGGFVAGTIMLGVSLGTTDGVNVAVSDG